MTKLDINDLTNCTRIAFSGKMYSGKTYYARCLKSKLESLGKSVILISFADGLKKIAVEYYGMKEKDRKLLQSIGRAMRSVDENVFVKYTERLITSYHDDITIIIDDLRFANEYQMLQTQDFVCIRINVDEEIRYRRFCTLTGISDSDNARKIFLERIMDYSETDLDNTTFRYVMNCDCE